MAGCSLRFSPLSTLTTAVSSGGASAAGCILAILADAAAAAGSHGSGRKRSLKSCTYGDFLSAGSLEVSLKTPSCCNQREEVAQRIDIGWP